MLLLLLLLMLLLLLLHLQAILGAVLLNHKPDVLLHLFQNTTLPGETKEQTVARRGGESACWRCRGAGPGRRDLSCCAHAPSIIACALWHPSCQLQL